MMSKTMTVTDAHLRLDQLKNGRIPSKETPLLGNPIYQKAYDGFLRFGALCNTLREGTDGAGGFLVLYRTITSIMLPSASSISEKSISTGLSVPLSVNIHCA